MSVDEFISTYMSGTATIAIFEGKELFYKGTVNNLYLKNDTFILNSNIIKIQAKNSIIILSVMVY